MRGCFLFYLFSVGYVQRCKLMRQRVCLLLRCLLIIRMWWRNPAFALPYRRNNTSRGHFSTRKFANKYKLGDPIAINFFIAEWRQNSSTGSDDYSYDAYRVNGELPHQFKNLTYFDKDKNSDDDDDDDNDYHHHDGHEWRWGWGSRFFKLRKTDDPTAFLENSMWIYFEFT